MARILLVKAAHFATGPGGYAVPAPLGLLYLLGAIREWRRGRDEFRLYDLRIPGHTPEDLRRVVHEFHPDIAGLSALTIESDSMNEAAAVIKRERPETTVIAGGPHATAYSKLCAERPDIDFVVSGEGEETFRELLDAIEGGDRSPESLAGIVYRDGERIVTTEARPFLQDLDALPLPAWDVHDFDAYKDLRPMSPVYFGTRSASVFTSRACPYRCIYCHGVFGKKFRAHSPGRVVDEIERLVRTYGVHDFEIIDDIFNFDQQRVHTICDEILARGLRIRMAFPNGLRGDRLSDETLEKMRAAGTVMVALAFESTSRRLQKLMKKHMQFDKIERALRTCDRLGIYTQGLFMLGFPTETKEELAGTVRYAARSRLTTALFSIVTPFEGTELMGFLPEEERGKIPKSNGASYLTGTTNLTRVSDEDLFHYHRAAFRRFYGSPRRLLRILQMWPGRRSRLLLAGLRTMRYALLRS